MIGVDRVLPRLNTVGSPVDPLRRMSLFLDLPGRAGASRRTRYKHWLPVHAMEFQRPLLEKDPAEFTIRKDLDALSKVIAAHAEAGTRIPYVRLHHVEGSLALQRLRFEDVVVRAVRIDGAADEAMECVTFSARRWRPER